MTRRDDLEAVLTHVADPSELLLVLDFDGTLSPIVDDPDAAAPADGAIAAVAALADRAVVAIVSGRHLDDLVPRVGELPVTLVGGHGTEVRDPDGTRTSLFDDGPVQHVLDTCEAELTDLLADVGGWRVERKPASLAVHHRTAVPADVERLLPRVRAVLAAPAADGPFDVLDGKAVTELRPSGVDKGRALRWLARRHPDRRVLVVGDDVTDEDAFEAADDLGGQAVLVSDSPRATAARWRIDDPVRVVWLLERLGAPGAVAPLGAEEVWTRRFHPIGEHGMIGDSRTAALVAPDASVEWMCVPRFDSPSVFAAILDPLRGGRFRVRPTRPLEVQRTYLGETNVVVTRFVDAGSPVLTVTDLLVTSRVAAFDPDHTGHVLLRRVEAFEDVEVEVEFQPRFDYARVPTRLERADGCVVATAETSDGPERAVLETDLPLEVVEHEDGNGDVARVRTTLAGGDTRWLTLRTGAWERSPHLHLSSEELLDLTVRTWGRWARAIDYDGPWREDVVRSALVLKGLVYEPTGALVAAPTTSLPEGLGGVRNWDYRYAWIRDSAYVLECFLRIGHTREAETFIRWLGELSDHIGGAHALRPLYRIDGEEDLVELELEHLEGYHGSKPVRIGNGAATQLQLDIYGAAMQLGWLTEQFGTEVPTARWPTIVELVETVAARWDEPDAGLWEIRSAPKHHTFSKFQCWLAVDRAIRIGEDLGLAGPYDRWRGVAAAIRDSILTHGYDEELGAFTQAYGEPHMDASLLLLPLKGFIAPTDPRVRSTVAAIRRELEVGDGLLLRYRTVDGLDGHEGAFLLCSYWLVELLARMGDLEEATRLFERLRRAAGPLGLYAEELDPATHLHLGNFPQAFTHMGLIGAATAIHEERSSRPRTGRG